MAECEEESNANHPVSQPLSLSLPFVEVVCKSSGLNRRFAAGTEAGFAVNLINRKISTSGGAVPLALHIEALKEGEEPVSFGPNSILVDYGHGWKLQTVTETQGLRSGKYIRMTRQQDPAVKDWDGSHSMGPRIRLLYIGKILLAFVLIFVLGAVFTIALENLPRLILYITSVM